MSVLFFIVAWWYAPGEGDRYDGNVIAAFFFAVCGLGFAIGGASLSIWQPSPFSSKMGRLLWFLRPRAWMVAWVIIAMAIWIFGKPAILYTYPVNRPGTCTYLTWDGLRMARSVGRGHFGGCRVLTFIHDH